PTRCVSSACSSEKAVKLLERNIPCFLRMSRGVGPKVSRRLCSKPQEESPVQPRGRPVLRVPGHKPTEWEKKCLLWAGHFKKPEDIPEVVSLDAIRAAQTTLRVKFSYVMIALTIVGCIVMVIRGKQVSYIQQQYYLCQPSLSLQISIPS
uniref:Family with sequence similarity 162 member A n=1 Tax=Coturnix japonica TaxID=93934 RepID=A0A8C2YEK6_COTJA